MNINIIAAIGNNNELGKDNKLIFNLPKDLEYFKNKTLGLPIIMGRKTFDSLKNKPLIGRQNIILTSAKNNITNYNNLFYENNIQNVINKAKFFLTKEVFIIGGASIYKYFLPLANKLFITKVNAEFDADVFFPTINSKEWKLIKSTKNNKDINHLFDFEFQEWQKI